ncbi:hypothetical protein CLU79DRAFT_833881 [Phycomyces nitens]|nr:hypothetical protein CLU79DRAFT_833881 [Phycomyces nitens]
MTSDTKTTCNKCNTSVGKSLKHHEKNYHAPSISVKYMESEDSEKPTILLLERNKTNQFECPFCKKTWVTCSSARSHFYRHAGKCCDSSANSSSDESDIEDTTIATIEMEATELVTVFPESVDSPRRSFDESILRALRQSDGSTCERNKALWIVDSLKLQPFALLDDNQVEEIALTHCDNIMPLMTKNQDHSFRVKHVTAGKKRAWDNSLLSTSANSTTNIEANLMSIQHYGPYAQQLSTRCYKQLDINSCQLLNDDWTFLPQLRYACAQLLAGAIIMNKNNEAVLVNTVEIYGRQRSLDVHRERIVNKKGKSASSSLPPVTTKYHYTWATIMTDSEGDKLTVGTKTLNALITSSLRIDSIHEASVGGSSRILNWTKVQL